MANKFYCVLAIDGAGKSTLLNSIKNNNKWKLVTYDDDFVPPEYEIINDIDKRIEKETLKYFPHFGKNFKSSLYSTYVYYLNDLVEKWLPENNILCNSYYYKILAKDILQNGPNIHIHNHWRGLRQPDKVFFLETSPELALERTSDISALFPNEYYGNTPTSDGFIKFQRDLREKMLEEIKDIKTVFLDGSKTHEELNDRMQYELTN